MLNLDSPLGFRLDGRPFWGFHGGDGEDGGDGNSGGTDNGGQGDGGDGENEPEMVPKADFDGSQNTLKKVRGELRGFKGALAKHGIRSLDDLEAHFGGQGGQSNGGQQGQGQQGGTQQQPPVDLERERRLWQAEQDAKMGQQLALSKVEVLAAKTFADPADAVLNLQGQVEDLVGEDGKPDSGAIESALKELLSRKPHLGIKEEKPADFDGGARGTASTPQGMDSFIRSKMRR